MAASQGALAKLCLDAVLPFDTSSEPFEFVRESFRLVRNHIHSNGITGSRSRRQHRTRDGIRAASGQIVMHPTPTELDLLWPRILGGTTAAGVTDVANTLPKFQVMIDRVEKVFSYTDCVISRAVITGEQGQPITLTLDIEGEDRTVGNSGTFPALTLPTDNIFIFSDLTFTYSTARSFRGFSLTLDNFVDGDRYFNSQVRQEMVPHDRQVTLSMMGPFDSGTSDLLDYAVAGSAASLVMTDGSTTYTFDFANMKYETDDPVVEGKSEIMMPMERFTSFHDGSNSELKVTKT